MLNFKMDGKSKKVLADRINNQIKNELENLEDLINERKYYKVNNNLDNQINEISSFIRFLEHKEHEIYS